MLFLATNMTDPGFIKKPTPSLNPTGKVQPGDFMALLEIFDPVSLCQFCEVIRTPRSRHCYLCNRCIERFDHHCPWVNTCIGSNNYRVFYFHVLFSFLFVLAQFLRSIYCKIIVLIKLICRHFNSF